MPPPASTAAVRRVMQGNRKVDSQPEVRLRRVLWHRGFRFRKNIPVWSAGLKVVPDIAFSRKKVAVFVDGCFWHSCIEHGAVPRTNVDYWTLKLERNRQRDRHVDDALARGGWKVIRIWEHEDPEVVADRIVCGLMVHLEP